MRKLVIDFRLKSALVSSIIYGIILTSNWCICSFVFCIRFCETHSVVYALHGICKKKHSTQFNKTLFNEICLILPTVWTILATKTINTQQGETMFISYQKINAKMCEKKIICVKSAVTQIFRWYINLKELHILFTLITSHFICTNQCCHESYNSLLVNVKLRIGA